MLFSRTSFAVLSLATGVLSQRPADMPICDYYTTALLKNNTAENQYTLLTLIVNTVVIGNYTQPNVGIAVPGILAKGTFNGVEVNLLPYFDGTLASSNRGGSAGVSVNFLDDGGAAPLMKNMPANGKSSRQYLLLTHLYEFFGALLGCTQYGSTAFPAYSGFASQASVHKFMKLDENEVGYFIQQVGLSAASFGAATADVTAVGQALGTLFNYRCSPQTTVIPAQGPQYQAICQADTCQLSPNATCAAYPSVMDPATATSTPTATGAGNSSVSATTSTGPMFTGASSKIDTGSSIIGALVLAAFSFLL